MTVIIPQSTHSSWDLNQNAFNVWLEASSCHKGLLSLTAFTVVLVARKTVFNIKRGLSTGASTITVLECCQGAKVWENHVCSTSGIRCLFIRSNMLIMTGAVLHPPLYTYAELEC